RQTPGAHVDPPRNDIVRRLEWPDAFEAVDHVVRCRRKHDLGHGADAEPEPVTDDAVKARGFLSRDHATRVVDTALFHHFYLDHVGGVSPDDTDQAGVIQHRL